MEFVKDFLIYEAGALCGFFIAALMNAARAGQEIAIKFEEDKHADALNAAFKEYSAAVLNKAERPSVLAKLHDLAQVIANLPDKVRHKEEERGL